MPSKRLIAIACLNQGFHWFILGLWIPVSVLLQLEKGFNLFQVGGTGAVYSGTILLLELPTGGLADTLGRKRVYLISLVMLFAAGIAVLIAWNFETMLIGFAFLGVARALSSGSLDAWFVDEFHRLEPEGNLQQALAKIGVWIPAGLGIGSLLAGILPMSLGKLTSQIPRFGIYSANILSIGVMIMVQFVLTSVLIHEEAHPAQHSGIWSGFKQLPEILSTSIQYGIKHRITCLLLFSTFCWGVSISGLEILWQPQVKGILGSDSQTWIFGVLSAGYFLASAFGSMLITPLCTLFHNDFPRILLGTRLFMGVILFFLAFRGTLPAFTVLYWSLFVFNGMGKSPHATIFNKNIPKEKRSTLLSFESFALQFGGLTGTLCMGYIADRVSIPVAWFIGAEVLVISSLAYVFLPQYKEKETADLENIEVL